MTLPLAPARRAVLAAGLAAAIPARAAPPAPAVVELRQYTCHRGGRNVLTGLFEREFITPQNALGAHVLAIFHDRDDPDRFVWMRGFESMPARAQALAAFYGGPVWKAHREAANATMLDSDNVLLLRPAASASGFAGPAGREVLAFIHYVDEPLTAPFAAFFARVMRPQIEADGARILATFATEASPNTFPALPVRERDRVFVWFADAGARGEAAFLARHHARSGWRDTAGEALLPAFMRKPEVLRLTQTARSPLR
jgi:hypothetical protein